VRIFTQFYPAADGGGPASPAGDSPPRAIRQVEPEYPFEARTQGVQGTVVVAVTVGADGVPKDVRAVRTLGLGMDEAAVGAAAQWRFAPARKDGRAVEAPASLQFSFRMQ
jgi:protein TonB